MVTRTCPLASLQCGAARARTERLAHRFEDRLEIVQAFRVDQGGELGVTGGGQHLATKLDELCPALAERLDQRVRRRRAGLGEAPGRVAELGAEVEEALGQRGEVTGKIVEFACIGIQRTSI